MTESPKMSNEEVERNSIPFFKEFPPAFIVIFWLAKFEFIWKVVEVSKNTLFWPVIFKFDVDIVIEIALKIIDDVESPSIDDVDEKSNFCELT